MGNNHSERTRPQITANEQRIILKYLYQKGNGAVKARQKLVKFAGKNALSESAVKFWFRQFEQNKWDDADIQQQYVFANNSAQRHPEGNAAGFLDEALTVAKAYLRIRGLFDPLRLSTIEFGDSEINGVCIYGLLSFYRSGPAEVTSLSSNRFEIDFRLAVRNIGIKLSYRIKKGVTLKGSFEAVVDITECETAIMVNSGGRANLANFRLVRMSRLNLTSFKGAGGGILDSIAQEIVNKLVQGQHRTIQVKVEEGVRDYIEKLLQSFDLRRFYP